MKFRFSVFSLAICAILLGFCRCQDAFSQDASEFKYEVNANGINIRSDSTTSAQVICMVDKGVVVYPVAESYGWYKIKLPGVAPAFINKTLVTPAGDGTGKTAKDKVNVRLGPNTSSAIIGKLGIDTPVKIVEDQGEWYRIEPTDKCYGWINKKFVNKIMSFAQPAAAAQAAPALPPAQAPAAAAPAQAAPPVPEQVFEGKIRPYGFFFFKKPVTHKLITAEKKVIFLKGEEDKLKALEYRQVKVTGKIISDPKDKYPLLEISKAEALD